MSPLPLVPVGWAVMAAVMLALRLVQRPAGNAGIVDVAWSFGTGLVPAFFAAGIDGFGPRRLLVGGLAAAWGLRPGVHLCRRVARGPEDGRDRMLREARGARTQRNLFRPFQVQAARVLLFSVPMMLFLLRVTGIPMTERRAIESRGDAYRRYQRTTNRFFPGPPRAEPSP